MAPYEYGFFPREVGSEEDARYEVALHAIEDWLRWAGLGVVQPSGCPAIAAPDTAVWADLYDLTHFQADLRSWVYLPGTGWVALVEWWSVPEWWAGSEMDVQVTGMTMHLGQASYRCLGLVPLVEVAGVVILGEPQEEGNG